MSWNADVPIRKARPARKDVSKSSGLQHRCPGSHSEVTRVPLGRDGITTEYVNELIVAEAWFGAQRMVVPGSRSKQSLRRRQANHDVEVPSGE
jgi:hypothetical protein